MAAMVFVEMLVDVATVVGFAKVPVVTVMVPPIVSQ